MLSKKTFRYYYWLVVEFIKKHLKLILISFLLSFFMIITLISLSPYLETLFSSKHQTIGLIGEYKYDNLPDEIISKISNGLVVINEKGKIVPAVASTFEIKDKGLRYRFHLKDNLFWDDGKKFTASDINYQFMDVLTKVIDDKTVDFVLKKELAIFPTYLKRPIVKYPLIGIAGSYKVDRIKTQYEKISELVLSPNKKDQPTLTYKFYSNESDLISGYKHGEINQFQTSKKNIADVFSTWKNTTIAKSTDYSKLLTLFFNFNNPALKIKEVRQAIIMTLDPGKLKEFGELAVGPVPPISWAYDPNLKTEPYDPAAAEKIIKKSGIASEEAMLKFSTYYDYLSAADLVSESIKKTGLNVNVKVLSYERGNDFDLLLALWNLPLDPDQYYFWHSTQTQGNISNYKNVKIDRLLELGREAISVDDRKSIYFEYQKVIQDDPPAAFLYFPYVYTISRK